MLNRGVLASSQENQCFPVSFISSSGKVSSIETFRPFCRIEMDRIVRIQPMQYIHLLDLVRASKIMFDVQICLNTAVYLETFSYYFDSCVLLDLPS